LNARTGRKYGRGELSELARAFDEMADRIRERDAERDHTEAALRESRESLARAQAIAHLGNFEVDFLARTSRWSDEIYRILGLDPQHTVPGFKTFLERVHPDDRASFERFRERLDAEHSSGRIELRIIRADGEERIVRLETEPTSRTGRLLRRSGIIQDITEHRMAEHERRSLEDQLRQAQKMEAIGRLAGGVAHDFNNLLTAVLGYAEIVLASFDEGDSRHDDVEEIIKAGQSATALTQQLLAFGRRQVLKPALVDLDAVVDDTIKMLRRVVGEDVTVVRIAGDATATIHADSSQLQQILLNLAVNARDSMPRGGTLTIETAQVEVSPESLGEPDAEPGRYAMLRISDTGTGMSPDVKERIFEPFFTTKERGRGTGLGLSTVYGIVKQSGGFIAVDTNPGQGTTFRVYLPFVSDETVEPDGVEATSAPASGVLRSTGSETVLVVDDERGVLELVAKALRRAGYEVLAVNDPLAASDACRRHPRAIDLLVTDLVMPGQNGPMLAAELRNLQPGLKVLFMSGYADETLGQRGIGDAGTRMLPKPFTTAGLLAAVRDALDS
jgi:PAS domain S-box-containing protein